MKSRVQQALFALTCLAVTLGLLTHVHSFYPIREWLFWRYAQAWLLTGVFLISSLSAGAFVIGRLPHAHVPVRERLTLSLAAGVYVFFLGVFAFGLLGVLGPVFGVLYPVALCGLGARQLGRWLLPAWRKARRLAGRPMPGFAYPALAFGFLAFVLLYANAMAPSNASYDARWYHLPLAEHYAVSGAVKPRPEGWVQATLPHLTSFLYSWPMMLPRLGYFDRIIACSHIELALVVGTVAQLPVLVRALIGGRTTLAWVALFLFPGILLYDSSPSLAADHVAAFFAIPILLTMRRAMRTVAPRDLALFALMAGAAMMTKYQAAMLVAFPVGAVVACAAWRAIRRPDARRVVASALGVATLVGLCATAPHWLKNWLWHGDPIYPFLYRWLDVRPWSPDAAFYFETVFKGEQLWVPTGTTAEKLWETTRALFTFAFVAHDWPTFHRDWPVFGFLFTLSVPLLLLLRGGSFRGTKRVWVLVLASHSAVFVWYWMSHQDRYLQALVPWLAAVVAAVIAMAWRAGRLARALVMLPVCAQLVWSGDTYFFSTHAMADGHPTKETLALMSSGFRRDLQSRHRALGSHHAIGRLLPTDAVVLIHEEHIHHGLMRPAVLDWIGWQFGLSYGRHATTAETWRVLRSMGVSHLVWRRGQSRGMDSLAADVRFFDLALNHAQATATHGGHEVARLADSEPGEPTRPDAALYLGCRNTYPPGVYLVSDLVLSGKLPQAHTYPPPRAPPTDASSRDVIAVITGAKCRSPAPTAPFVHAARREDGEDVWIRQRNPR